MSGENRWRDIAAPLPASAIQWRQDGKATARGGKFFARFVAYIDAQFVRERLDSVVPGEWTLALDPLPTLDMASNNEEPFAFKARLTIVGVAREDVGSGKDYKTASSDAFKRAAVRFGIAHELYAYEQNWVEVDGDGKYAKPVEDPASAYAKRQSRASQSQPEAKAPQSGSPAKSGGYVKVMPFGKFKGTSMGELASAELERTKKWCTETDAAKFKDLIATCNSILADRSLGVPVTDEERDAIATARLAAPADDLDLPF
jgi:hypothetical protein